MDEVVEGVVGIMQQQVLLLHIAEDGFAFVQAGQLHGLGFLDGTYALVGIGQMPQILHVEVLVTPGILWPKIEDRNVGERLAMIGSINDQILNIEELALETIKFLRKNYQPQLYSRYDITEDIFDNVDTETMMNPENAAALCIMEHIARKRGCIKKGSDIDYEKCAACILDDFREGKIGTISLERP